MLHFFLSLEHTRIKAQTGLLDHPWKEGQRNCQGIFWRRKSMGIVAETTYGYSRWTKDCVSLYASDSKWNMAYN